MRELDVNGIIVFFTLEFALMWLLFCRLTHTHREKSPRGEKKESSRRTRNEIEVSLSVTWVTITCVQKRSSLSVCVSVVVAWTAIDEKTALGGKLGIKKMIDFFPNFFLSCLNCTRLFLFFLRHPQKMFPSLISYLQTYWPGREKVGTQ